MVLVERDGVPGGGVKSGGHVDDGLPHEYVGHGHRDVVTISVVLGPGDSHPGGFVTAHVGMVVLGTARTLPACQ